MGSLVDYRAQWRSVPHSLEHFRNFEDGTYCVVNGCTCTSS